MTTTQRDAITSAATDLVIYNTITSALEVYTGSSWTTMGSTAAGVPTGAIAAFASASCPSGWTEYTAARGRFLRGIDNGAGNDPSGTRTPGNVQTDDLKSHSHSILLPRHKAHSEVSTGLSIVVIQGAAEQPPRWRQAALKPAPKT
jgi:hypothetical protein